MTYEKTRQISQTTLATALIAVLANLSIPIQPVPIPLLTFGIGLVVSQLKPKQAVTAGCLYLLLSSTGFPVFTNGNSGFHHLLSPTNDFLLGIPLYSLTTSLLVTKARTILHFFLANTIGDSLLFICGSLGLIIFGQLDSQTALTVGILPFIPLELGKLIIISLIAKKQKISR